MPQVNHNRLNGHTPPGTTSAVAPFDAAAATYDSDFSQTRLGRWMRAAVWQQLVGLFQPGEHVLELGCGTGEDAVWMARHGLRVTACDVSPEMLAVARHKAAAAGVGHQVAFQQFDLRTLQGGGEPRTADGRPRTEGGGRTTEDGRRTPARARAGRWSVVGGHYDGVLSNFGALNCLEDRRPLAAALAQIVRPGGRLALVLMGPLCPWEIAWHLLRGQPGAALRRLRRGALAHAGGGRYLPVWYPSPWRLRREFAPHFRHVQTLGVGALLPPPYLEPLVARAPRLFGTLALIERRVAGRFPWPWLNDHYMAIFERRGDVEARMS